ncbi:MAG: hypothetical protein EBR30_12055 [Cytophagia bacterium]|nr:hypothetical protein [Cytophagia bacterium]
MASRSAVSSVGVTSSAVVRPNSATYHGYSFRAGGSGATITIYDNASAASGTILDVVTIAANGTASAYYSVEDCYGGLRAVNGIYFSTDNAVTGSVRVAE